MTWKRCLSKYGRIQPAHLSQRNWWIKPSNFTRGYQGGLALNPLKHLSTSTSCGDGQTWEQAYSFHVRQTWAWPGMASCFGSKQSLHRKHCKLAPMNYRFLQTTISILCCRLVSDQTVCCNTCPTEVRLSVIVS